jgi:hypothetical protein
MPIRRTSLRAKTSRSTQPNAVVDRDREGTRRFRLKRDEPGILEPLQTSLL